MMATNTTIRAVYWEPVSGTGERLAVGAIVHREGTTSAHRLIRDDLLRCMYGNGSDGAARLIESGLHALRELLDDSGSSVELPPVMGMHAGESRDTEAADIPEALRICALMYSSLANLDALDEEDATDAPLQDDANRNFTTKVRQIVASRHPELDRYFNRSVPLLQDGVPARFGFANPRSIMHFGVLSPVRQSSSVRDARARLWELHRAREFASMDFAALIIATPSLNDPTLSDRQVRALNQNLQELNREADSYSMRSLPVQSVEEAAELVIDNA